MPFVSTILGIIAITFVAVLCLSAVMLFVHDKRTYNSNDGIGMLITLFILAICAAYFAVKLIVCEW